MNAEYEKCMAGEWYDCHDPFFLRLKARAHRLLMRYNAMPYDDKENKYALLCQMLGSVGRDVSVGHAFTCDYGRNIHIGNNVSVNTGCTFVDCNRIDIGSNVLIGPNAQIYTATHPVDLAERLAPLPTADGIRYERRTYALPVTVCAGCWIGGGTVILPGVTIGAGSVVTKDIPADVVAAGNPCRILRRINGK